jgi:hypothetical protein
MAVFKLVRTKEAGEDGTKVQRANEQLWHGQEIVAHGGLTLEELTDYCDMEAESRNNHRFVTTHRLLACLLCRDLGRQLATSIMLSIAERGGLDGMSGMDYFTPENVDGSYEEFGIKANWAKWTPTKKTEE